VLNVFSTDWVRFFQGGSRVPADEDDRRPSILQLHTEGFTANKISVIEHLQERGIGHRPSGDPLHNCRQVSDSQPLTSWVSPEHEAGPCHVCTRAIGMDTGRPVSWAVRDSDFARYKTIHVYKPPLSRLTPTAIPTFPHPILYVGDFNWGCRTTSPNGKSLDSWATANNLELLHDPRGVASFSFHRWNVGTNTEAFASVGHGNWLPHRRVLGRFPRLQYRLSLITPPGLKVPASNDQVKRWDFRKADWKRFCLLTGESVVRLPPPDTKNIEKAYQELFETLQSAARQYIPHGRRKNYVPGTCWTKGARPFLTLLRPRPSVDWLWRNRFVPTFTARREGAGAMGRNCQFHRLLARQPQGLEYISKRTGKNGHWTLMASVPRLSKLHRLITHEKRGTQYLEPQVHMVYQQSAVRTMEGSNTWVKQYLWPLEELAATHKNLEPGKSPGMDSISRCLCS